MLIANGYLLLFVQRVEGTGVEGQGTAVISCHTFLSKLLKQTVVNQLSWGFNPDVFFVCFFWYCDGTCFGLLL